MGTAKSGLLELLSQHGVPEKGARVYLAACRAGAMTASELARVSSVNRVEAYRFIKQLSSEGLLRATGSRPRRFEALPPDDLIDRWIHGASERLHQLEKDRDRVLNEWEEGRDEFDERDPRKFAVIEGKEAIRRFLQKRIGTTDHQILVSASGRALSRFVDLGLDRAFREASGRGVKVRVVTEVQSQNLVEAKHFSGFSELRHSSSPVGNRTVVFDRLGSLVYVSSEDGLGRSGEEQVALWSSAPMFIRLACDYHRRLWTPATRAETRFVELESPPEAFLPVVSGKESIPFQRLEGGGQARNARVRGPQVPASIARAHRDDRSAARPGDRRTDRGPYSGGSRPGARVVLRNPHDGTPRDGSGATPDPPRDRLLRVHQRLAGDRPGDVPSAPAFRPRDSARSALGGFEAGPDEARQPRLRFHGDTGLKRHARPPHGVATVANKRYMERTKL